MLDNNYVNDHIHKIGYEKQTNRVGDLANHQSIRPVVYNDRRIRMRKKELHEIIAAMKERHLEELEDFIERNYEEELKGGGLWDDFKDGMRKAYHGYRTVTKNVAVPVANIVGMVGGPKGRIAATALLTGDKILDQVDPHV